MSKETKDTLVLIAGIAFIALMFVFAVTELLI